MYTYHCKNLYVMFDIFVIMASEILNHVNMLPSEESCINMFRSIFYKTKVPMNVIFYILFNLPFKSVNMMS